MKAGFTSGLAGGRWRGSARGRRVAWTERHRASGSGQHGRGWGVGGEGSAAARRWSGGAGIGTLGREPEVCEDRHPYAPEIIRQIESHPLQLYPCDQVVAVAAAKVKADFPMAYADAFAVATALRENAALLTGEPEFAQVEHLVKIDRL